jgi:heme A synthase
VLALVLSATVTAFVLRQEPAHTGRVSLGSAFARWILLTLLAVFFVLVSGVLVAADGSVVRCLSWPLFAGALDLDDLCGWLELARRLLAGVATILVIATAAKAWREKGAVRTVGAAVGTLFLAELGLGAFRLVFPDAILLQLLHVATAAAFWALLVVLTMLAGLTLPTSPE